MSFSFSHPVNTALLLYILYLLQRIILPSASVPRSPPTEFKGGYSWMPRTHAPSVLFTTYTPRSLEKFSGIDGGRILLAIAGTVFDVTAGRGFYGPGKCSLSLQLPRQRKVADEYVKMGCTGILRVGMRRGVWRNNRLMLARLTLSLCALSIADPIATGQRC